MRDKKGRLLLAALCLTLVSADSFIKEKKLNNENVKEFTIDLEERGTNLTQTVILDIENGLVITDVPAHNDLDPITNYHDENLGLTLKVNHRTRECTIFRPFFSSTITEMEKNLKGTSQDRASPERMVIEPQGDHSNTAHYHLTEFRCGDGFPLDDECIPPKLRQRVPPGFPTFVTRILQLPKGNVRIQRGNASQALLVDPLTQRTYNFGDPVEVCDDSLREILPHCPAALSRKKRQAQGAQEEYNEWCRDEHFNRVERCAHRSATCRAGCTSELIAYDCNNPSKDCDYVIICKDIPPMTNSTACIRHLLSDGWTCRPCCRSTSCGKYLPICKNMPEHDICPPSDKGCPYDRVEKKFIGEESHDRCYVHEECDSVINEDGNRHQSGIQCDKITKKRREARFCCRTDEEFTESQARNRSSQLPFCHHQSP